MNIVLIVIFATLTANGDVGEVHSYERPGIVNIEVCEEAAEKAAQELGIEYSQL